MIQNWTPKIFGKNLQWKFLLLVSCVLLFTLLGTKDLWTQEHRWADIVSGMFFRQDFFHPYLGQANYYDKPLLSYWLMAFFSVIFNGVTTWALRIPSALSALLSIYAIYSIGSKWNKSIGLLSGWMLLTTYYFIFWGRTSSADMLNLGGSLLAVAWFVHHEQDTSFKGYSVFFMILALTSLCKGLVGAIVPLLAIFPYLILTKTFKKHLNLMFFVSLIPALIVYALPFWASTHLGAQTGYHQNGLYLVYKENFLRYFQPFDHKGPIYTYFIFLPVYLLPWTLFFIPAIISAARRWKALPLYSQWLCLAVLLLFIFFTLSGSRRNYYVLPIVPFAILMTADWLMRCQSQQLWKAVNSMLVVAMLLLVSWFNIAEPFYYQQKGMATFVNQLKQSATKIHPWDDWNIVLLDAETKMTYYLDLPPNTPILDVEGERKDQSKSTLLNAWPILKKPNHKTIYVTRFRYQTLLSEILPSNQIVVTKPSMIDKWFKLNKDNEPLAFILS